MLNYSIRQQRGFSLTELMVGITVGLIALAGITTFFANFLSSNRTIVQAARLDHELRTAMDMVSRDIKRAGYKRDIHLDVLNLSPTTRATYLPTVAIGKANITGSTIEFWYDENSDNAVDITANAEKHGYRLNGTAIQRHAPDGSWQNVTDPAVVQVTGFTLTRIYRCIDIDGTGPATCAPAGAPTPEASSGGAYFVTEVAIRLSGRLVNNTNVTRTLDGRVRMRADIYREDA